MATAGMCKGTPDWQLDRLFETDTAKRLEEAYADGDDYTDQVNELEECIRNLDKVVGYLHEAEQDFNGTGYEFTYGIKIADALHEIEDVNCDIKAIIRLLKGGGA